MIETVRRPGVRKYGQKNEIHRRIDPGLVVFALALLGFALRIFMVRYRYAVAFDEVNYLKLGVSGYLDGLAAGLHTYWSPLLPGLISFSCHLFTDYEFGARMVSVVAGALLVIPAYHIARHVFGARAGILAAAFVALFPPLAFQDTLILTEPLTMLFGGFSVLFGLKTLSRYSVGYAFLAGAAAGFAYLAHPLGVGFLLMLLGWVLAAAFLKSFLVRPLRLAYLLPALLFGFSLAAAPYLMFLKHTTGAWTLSAKGAANQQMSMPLQGKQRSFRALDSANRTVPIDQVFHQGTFLQSTHGGANPVRRVRVVPFVTKYIKNVSNILQRGIPPLLTTLPLMLMGVGLFGLAWPVQKAKYIVFLLSYLVFFWLLFVPAFHLNPRYLSPMWPVCAVFIGQGAAIVYARLSDFMPITRRAWKKTISARTVAGAILAILLFLVTFLPELGRVVARSAGTTEYVGDAVEQKRAGLWLKAHYDGTPVIMSRNHAVDFYAGNYDIVESVTIPTNSFERILAYARYRQVTHIVLNERYLQDYPDLKFLLARNARQDGLKQIYFDVEKNGLATAIYRLRESRPGRGSH